MFYLPSLLLFLLTSSDNCNAAIHVVHPLQKLSRNILDPPSTNQTATVTFTPTHYGSHNTFSARILSRHTQNVNSSITALPVPLNISVFKKSGPDTMKNVKNYENIKLGFCESTDNFCSFKEKNGIITEARPTNMDDQCVLWDTSCSGNKTLAIKKFFNLAFPRGFDPYNKTSIMGNDCFAQNPEISQSDCDTFNSPDRLSEWQKIKDWMRSPQCVSDAEEWQNMTGAFWGFIFRDGLNESYSDYKLDIPGPDPSCCQTCFLQVQNVDLYYWPEPDADLSCLSIIGGSVRPLNHSATFSTFSTPADTGSLWTLTTQTYWACNSTHRDFSGTTFRDLTTATITTIGDLSVKVPLYNPWESPPCAENDAGSQGSNASNKIRDRQASVRARDHFLIITSSLTQQEGLPMTTVVSGDFTL